MIPTDLTYYIEAIAEKMMAIGSERITPYSTNNLKLLFLYSYYRYAGADDNKAGELSDAIFYSDRSPSSIGAVFQVDDEPKSFEVLIPYYLPNNSAHLNDEHAFSAIQNAIQELLNPNENIRNKEAAKILSRLGLESHITLILISSAKVEPNERAHIRRQLAKSSFPFSSWEADIVTCDDIISEITEAEDPLNCVQEDFLTLIDGASFSFYGQEKSFISAISADSLRNVYLRNSTKGLFASNLRYYVKAIKIDSAINRTIIDKPEQFWYLNNGIIITCSDYSIQGQTLHLKQFSIVNGGQTTNIIGNSNFEKDFAIPCKIIRSGGNAKDSYFLDSVAEASNTQKPIKPKDLIANRPEQKYLKAMLADCGIFLQVKRGDHVNKIRYPEKWQTITNDDLAKLITSSVYQEPGLARSSPQKLFSDDVLYNNVFLHTFSSNFIKDLIIIQVAYQEWVSKGYHNGDYRPARYEVAKIGLQLMTAIIGLLSKSIFNPRLQKCLEKGEDDNFKIAYFISQRDIGFGHILRDSFDYEEDKEGLFKLFSYIERKYILEAYAEYQSMRLVNGAPATNFVRDKNAYRGSIVHLVFQDKNVREFFAGLLYKASEEEIIKSSRRFIDDYRPGLKIELNAYGNEHPTLSAASLGKICQIKPQSTHELSVFVGLSDKEIEDHGKKLIEIVKKYDESKDDSVLVISSLNFHR